MARTTPIRGGRLKDPNLEAKTFEIENAEECFEGGFGSLRDLGNGTAGNRGRIGAYTGAKGEVFVGEFYEESEPSVPSGFGAAPEDGKTTGDTTATPPPRVKAEWRNAIKLGQVVTGVSSIADLSRLVYAVDDDALTLTPQTRPDAVGVIVRRYTDDTVDVLFFGLSERFAGCKIQRQWLNPGDVVAVTGTSGDKITGYPMPCKGLFLTLGYRVIAAITGTPDTVLNAELGGTDITGGTLAIAAASAGAYAVGTSYATAAHYFSRGDLLDIEISGSAAATGTATVNFFIDILTLPGT